MCHLETIVISTPSYRNDNPFIISKRLSGGAEAFSADCTVFDTVCTLAFPLYQTADSRNTPQACKKSLGHIELIARRHLKLIVVPNFFGISKRESFQNFYHIEKWVISKLDSELTVISKRVISNRQPQGIGKPVALRAFLTSFYSFSFSHISKMPCGTALSALASEPFLSHLWRG